MEFLTDSEYQELAVRYVKNFVTRRNMPRTIIDDPDAINMVIEAMMKADNIFDGRGNRIGFRFSYAKYGFLSYITKVRGLGKGKKKLVRGIPLSTFKRKDLEKEVDIATCDQDPSEGFNAYEIRQKIVNSDLTERQKDCIIGFFYDKTPRQEIAEKWGCSRQYIDHELKISLRKLRTILKDYEDVKITA